MTDRYWHGGKPGLRPGDLIEPTTGDEHLLDGCPVCEARRAGQQLADDPNDPTKVYVTTDREYARIYAAGYPDGGLYVVEPIGPMERTTDDEEPSWAVSSARVLRVYDPLVRLDAKQVRRIVRRYGHLMGVS